MVRYIIRRLLWAIVTLIILSFLTFLDLLRASAG
jgi:ABC-type dipeptide/oligopeptide/nickel transport system permease component